MRRTRTKYIKEFKNNAVNLVLRSDRSIVKIAAELGIEYTPLYRFKRELSTYKEERDILKKAVAIFSKETK